MIANALLFLLHTLLGLFSLAVLLRFYLQLTGAPFQNPASQAIFALTNFAVKPLRRFIPSWGKLDLSTLLLAYFSQFLLQLGVLWLRDFPLFVAGQAVWGALLGIALIGVFKLSVYIFLFAVFIQAILSWINPYTPMSSVLDALTRPILNPLRKRIPMAGGIDLTPLVVFICAQLLLILLISPLEQQFASLL
ncbi:MAG TPA: YggT family protein [Methylophilaceae bacterium]|nr:YggT family protein [Methylophilaceae bacterium]